jgi:hypothetical protein
MIRKLVKENGDIFLMWETHNILGKPGVWKKIGAWEDDIEDFISILEEIDNLQLRLYERMKDADMVIHYVEDRIKRHGKKTKLYCGQGF